MEVWKRSKQSRDQDEVMIWSGVELRQTTDCYLQIPWQIKWLVEGVQRPPQVERASCRVSRVLLSMSMAWNCDFPKLRGIFERYIALNMQSDFSVSLKRFIKVCTLDGRLATLEARYCADEITLLISAFRKYVSAQWESQLRRHSGDWVEGLGISEWTALIV